MQTNSQRLIGATILAAITSLLTLMLLIALHVLSPEFDPSWRMVSEYANGNYSWLLSVFFIVWAVSSFALAYALAPMLSGRKGKAGLILLIIGGVGELMAAAFDINHSLHSLSSFLGIGGTLLAATLIIKQLKNVEGLQGNSKLMMASLWFMWASLLAMVISFIVLIVTYSSSGADMTASSNEITTLPEGVIALVGWANRLVVVSFCVWVGAVSYSLMQFYSKNK